VSDSQSAEKTSYKFLPGHVVKAARNFMRMEASGGILLVLAALIAIIIANSPLFVHYDHILNHVKFRIGFNDMQTGYDLEIRKSILLWINDGFMAVFFFLVGLEIKREITNGELSTRARALLPALAAIGGMVVPALIYPLYFAAAALVGLLILNRRHVSSTTPYILLGIILWIAVLKSGVHATLAGVATAFFIPMTCKKNPEHSPCKHLEHSLHPWVAFGILPIFAFANAGVPFTGMGLHSLGEPVTLGIIAGLVVGKQLGIFSVLWLTIKTGISPMPQGVTWLHLYAVSILCGIGFTMSLFIGGLAFDDLAHQASIRLGVLVGSMISAFMGFALLYFAPEKKDGAT